MQWHEAKVGAAPWTRKKYLSKSALKLGEWWRNNFALVILIYACAQELISTNVKSGKGSSSPESVTINRCYRKTEPLPEDEDEDED